METPKVLTACPTSGAAWGAQKKSGIFFARAGGIFALHFLRARARRGLRLWAMGAPPRPSLGCLQGIEPPKGSVVSWVFFGLDHFPFTSIFHFPITSIFPLSDGRLTYAK